jgi:DnaJ-class molecular chaperone
MNPYEELDVPKNASREEIERAYKKLAKETHPDAGGDPNRFASVSRAVAILRDPVKRQHFDETGTEETRSRSARLEGALAECLNALIQAKEDFGRADLAELMASLFEGEREKQLQTQSENERQLARIKSYRKRFKQKKRQKNDPINRILDGRASQIRLEIAKAKDEALFFQECKTMCEGYTAAPDLEEILTVFSPMRWGS